MSFTITITSAVRAWSTAVAWQPILIFHDITFQKMPSFAFLQKDEEIHRNLIQNVYNSLISGNDDNLIHVTLKNDVKMSVNAAIFKLFSPLINSIISEKTYATPEIILPDFSVVPFRYLIDILTNGSALLSRSKKQCKILHKGIQCLAASLGININLNKVVSNKEDQIQPSEGLTISSLSYQFIEAEVPNILESVDNQGGNEAKTSLKQPSDVIEVSDDDEDIQVDQCDVSLDEAAVCDIVFTHPIDPGPSSKGRNDRRASVNFCNLTSKANNNEKYSTSFTCFKCDYPAEFRTAKELYNHEIMLHRDTRPRIECIICIPSEKYYTVEDLAKHISTSHDSAPKSCPLCNCKVKKPYSAFKLANHMMNCHQAFQCDICSLKFSQLSGLNQHHAMKHQPRIRTLSCKLCLKKSKMFISANDLAQHTADVHGIVIKKLESKYMEEIDCFVN